MECRWGHPTECMFTTSTCVCKSCMNIQSWHMEYYMEQVIWKHDSCNYALDKLQSVINLVMWYVLYFTVHVCKNLALSTFFETAVTWHSHSAQSRLFSKIQFITNHQQDNGRIQNSCGLAVVIPARLLWLFIPWEMQQIVTHFSDYMSLFAYCTILTIS